KYLRAKGFLKQVESALGISTELDQQRAELEQRLADANKTLATEQEQAQQSPVLPAQAAQAVETYRQQAIAELAARYPEARDTSGLARLQIEDPTRFSEFQRDYAQADSAVRAARGLAIENQAAYAQQFADAGKTEDAKISQAHPELQKNPQARQAVAEE